MRKSRTMWGTATLRTLAVLFGALALSAGALRAGPPPGPRQSSPIAISADDSLLVNVNPDANSLSVYSVQGDSLTKIQEIPVGRDPSSVALSPAGARAFVANSLDGTVSVVDLANVPGVLKTIGVGAE